MYSMEVWVCNHTITQMKNESVSSLSTFFLGSPPSHMCVQLVLLLYTHRGELQNAFTFFVLSSLFPIALALPSFVILFLSFFHSSALLWLSPSSLWLPLKEISTEGLNGTDTLLLNIGIMTCKLSSSHLITHMSKNAVAKRNNILMATLC